MDYQPIHSSREPNPLRPYYVPAASSAPIPGSSPAQPAYSSSGSLSSSARDLLPDLDIDVDFPGSASEAWQNTRTLVDALVYKYSSLLLAQPFDVAKILLQVSGPPETGTTERRAEPVRRRRYQDEEDQREDDNTSDDETTQESADSSDEMPDYFSSAAPSTSTTHRSRSPRKRRRTPPTASLSPTPTPRNRSRRDHDSSPEYYLNLKHPDSVTHVMSALYSTSGALGLWRATNATFLYTLLLRTTDTFLRSLLLAVLGLPDNLENSGASGLGGTGFNGMGGLSGVDLSDSPNCLASLAVVAVSSGCAALLLAPLDLIRTRLVVTPSSHGPRGLLPNLRRLPSLLAPSSLWLPTALAHTLPQTFSAGAPLLLRRFLKLTPETQPAIWSLAAFGTCLTDLFIRLPLETIQRRAQISVLKQAEPLLPMIVSPPESPYRGVAATVYSIVYTEGETRGKDPRTGMVRIRKGQGARGLVRGWRVGFWGLVGVWGAGALGSGEGGRGRGEF